jgi:hypothetical protein
MSIQPPEVAESATHPNEWTTNIEDADRAAAAAAVLDIQTVEESAIPSQATLVESAPAATSLQPLSSSQTLVSSQEPSQESALIAPSHVQASHSYYRTAKEREMDLAIPSPRKGRVPVAAAGPSSPVKYSTQHGSYYRQRPGSASQLAASDNQQQGMPYRKAASLFSDARAELMINAARKIGRKRVGLAAGFIGAQIATIPERPEETRMLGQGKGKERASTQERSRASSEKGKAKVTEDQERDSSVSVKKQRRRTAKKTDSGLEGYLLLFLHANTRLISLSFQ